MADDRVHSTLHQIGQALGLSADTFFGDGSASQEKEGMRRLVDEIELFKLFSTVKDPAARKAILDYVRKIADAPDTGTAN